MFIERLEELNDVLIRSVITTPEGTIAIDEAIAAVHLHFQESKRIYTIGNGGSAGIASHFSVDLLNTLGLCATTLCDASLMTCMGNDFGYEEIYSMPLRIVLQEGDLLIAISSSGSSPNILNAVRVAQERGAVVITLSGFNPENPLRKLGEINFWVPAQDFGLVEMGHFFLLHTLVDARKGVLSHATKD